MAGARKQQIMSSRMLAFSTTLLLHFLTALLLILSCSGRV
jgi:hypothetical protein